MSQPGPTRVAIALGSNVGDREAHLQFAIEQLHRLLSGLHPSSFHDTAPAGVLPQPRFLNAAVVGMTTLGARELLAELLSIEQQRGRLRPYVGSPRTLDLDLIFYGEERLEDVGLVVPHPRFRDRRFVLAPLAEVAADWKDPVTGLTVAQLLARLA